MISIPKDAEVSLRNVAHSMLPSKCKNRKKKINFLKIILVNKIKINFPKVSMFRYIIISISGFWKSFTSFCLHIYLFMSKRKTRNFVISNLILNSQKL